MKRSVGLLDSCASSTSFTTRAIVLTADREKALTSSATLLSNAVERHRAAGRIRHAGEELMSSITEVERNAAHGGSAQRHHAGNAATTSTRSFSVS